MNAAPQAAPALRVDGHGAAATVTLTGDWTLRALLPRLSVVQAALAEVHGAAVWDLDGVIRLDTFGATLLWRH
ncbi:MAG TPA: hypothetical protein PLL39_09730, partial [Rhodocyclaceae bacterium]|nr:hypothetical protein [Rhodocyclaceae bacterium]